MMEFFGLAQKPFAVVDRKIDATRYHDAKVVILTSNFGIVGIDYAI